MRIVELLRPPLTAILIAAVAVMTTRDLASANMRRHTALTRSEPAANDTLAAAPTAIKLWFSDKVELKVTTVKLKHAGGTALALGAPTRSATDEKAPVVLTITAKLTPGSYTVSWSVAAKDGHPAKGSFGFVVKSPR